MRWEDWFFVIFGQTSWYDRLSSILIDGSSEVGGDEIFHDTVFDRVKTDYSDLSSYCKLCNSLRYTGLDMLELRVDCDTDIEEILLECELTILPLEFPYLISLGSVLIENPDIVDPETSDEYDSQYIRLSE